MHYLSLMPVWSRLKPLFFCYLQLSQAAFIGAQLAITKVAWFEIQHL